MSDDRDLEPQRLPGHGGGQRHRYGRCRQHHDHHAGGGGRHQRDRYAAVPFRSKRMIPASRGRPRREHSLCIDLQCVCSYSDGASGRLTDHAGDRQNARRAIKSPAKLLSALLANDEPTLVARAGCRNVANRNLGRQLPSSVRFSSTTSIPFRMDSLSVFEAGPSKCSLEWIVVY